MKRRKMSKFLQSTSNLFRFNLTSLRSIRYSSIDVSSICDSGTNDFESFRARDLSINLNTKAKNNYNVENVAFGEAFSSHMLVAGWNNLSGWSKPAIFPLANFNIHPGAKVFHYAIELFEGMKAYRTTNDDIQLFRPDMNFSRMNRTALRSSLPTFDENEILECLKILVGIDHQFVPSSKNSSLYIRPVLMGVEERLCVTKSNKALLYIATGPVGAYYKKGFNPISLLAEPKYVRAAEGGTGSFKMGCNYAPTIDIQTQAVQQNCDQVLWLYGKKEFITEVGAMNLFIYWTNEKGQKELVTPPLDGLILPGVTRASILELAKNLFDFKISESRITMGELIKGINENRVHEMFGAGTACVVCPIEKILYRGKFHSIPVNKNDKGIMNQLLTEITDIQYGRKEKDGWTMPIEKLDFMKVKESMKSVSISK
ncbi:hypothetical protein SNEBB_010584 [Seison nebaliae]|nr:hypothetical protein SNEBB_010584 [Seison nebaliae]